MAVHAHQPSNLLHLKGNEQEMNPSGFGVLDDSSIFLSSIGGYENPRKRGREVGVNDGSQFLLMQSKPSFPRPQKMIRLDQQQQQQQQSHNHPALVSTGLKLAFGEQNLGHNVVNKINPVPFSSSSEDFGGPVVGQYSKELDQLLQAQGEQLRETLVAKQQAHYKQLLLAAERSAAQILKKKQTELDRLLGRTAELENQLTKLQTESFSWQSKAIASQTAANSLYAHIQQVMAVADAATLAGGGCGQSPAEDAGSACIDPNRTEPDGKLMCRVCGDRTVSVVMLPCRHLCLCEECDVAGVAGSCPVCDCVGSGSVRVFLC